jgi:hypothetical protein
MVLSNYLVFKYCDSNIGLYSIAPCIVIAVNLLCSIFGIISIFLCFISLPLIVIAVPAIVLGVSDKVDFTFHLPLRLKKKLQLSLTQ